MLLISRYDADRIRRLMAGVLIGTRGTAFMRVFYEHLFDGAPELRPLFPINLAAQERKLLLTISVVVKNLDRDEELRRLALHLREVHEGIRIEEGHIEAFLGSLGHAFQQVHGSPFPRHDWLTLRRAVFSVSNLMLQVAAAPPRLAPNRFAGGGVNLPAPSLRRL
jgi:hemoglobin-like flavoprotein